MSNIEAFVNQNADAVPAPLRATTATGPVLACPALTTGVDGCFMTLGLIAVAGEGHHAAEVSATGPVPNYGSVDELLGMRVASIN